MKSKECKHCAYQGDEPVKVQKAVAKIKEIIQQGIDVSGTFTFVPSDRAELISWHLSTTLIFAVTGGLQPVAPDAAAGAGDAQWHPQRGRHC